MESGPGLLMTGTEFREDESEQGEESLPLDHCDNVVEHVSSCDFCKKKCSEFNTEPEKSFDKTKLLLLVMIAFIIFMIFR